MLGLLVGLIGCSGEQAEPPAPEVQSAGLQFPLERTQARMERGQYLASGVVLCLECHSETDWDKPGAPFVEGSIGGGEIFPLEGLPGRVVASNISPDKETGAGDWTDEDFYRAITQGIGKDGRALFPLMPSMFYRNMSDEDIASIIVYVRSIDPVEHELPKTELPEEVRATLQPLPPKEPGPAPDLSDPAKRGAYLANAAICVLCHTAPQPNGAPQDGMAFAGGWLIEGPWGSVASANITPDASGISYYDEEIFLDTMRTGKVKKVRELNSLMPVRIYHHMNDEDLKDIFAFLKTLPAIVHRVDNTETPTPCKRCGFTHGLGDMN